MNAATLACVAARRSALYWLLAEFLLTCPDRSFVSRLRRDLGAAADDQASDPLAAEIDALRDTLPGQDDAAGIAALAVEHTRLFGGISSGYGPPPPYESVQRGAAESAEPAAAVARCYSDAGLAVIDEAVPPDHLGVELKFVALLCHGEMEAWQHGRHTEAVRALGQQQHFLNSHLLRWAPEYWRSVQADAKHGFFRGVAAIAIEAVSKDRALLEEMLGTLDAV